MWSFQNGGVEILKFCVLWKCFLLLSNFFAMGGYKYILDKLVTIWSLLVNIL